MMAITEYVNILLMFSVCVSACVSDYYSVLGVPYSASEKEIRKAFRRLALKIHPDINHRPDAHQVFTHLAQAYEVLSDRERRRLYDQRRHLDQCKKREEKPFDKSGFYNSDLLPLRLHDLLEMLHMEEDLFMEAGHDLDQGWSFFWDETQEEDGDHLSNFFGIL